MAAQIRSPLDAPVEPIRAGTVSDADLQKRLDAIAAKKQAIEEARQARIRAAREARRKAAEKKRLIAEKAAREKVAQAAARKAAKEKAAKEKAAKEKAAKEKAAKAAKAAAEQAARKKAQQAAKAKAEREKATRKAAVEKAERAVIAFNQATREKIKRFLTLPDLDGDLHVQLLIHLDRQGRVIPPLEVKRSSGYPFVDEAVKRAVQAASPLPLTLLFDNQEVLKIVLDKGLELNL